MNKINILKGMVAILMILFTLSSALALDILGVSNVDYIDGTAGTMNRKFLMTAIETPTGNDYIAAGTNPTVCAQDGCLKDSVTGEYASKNLNINEQLKEYSCDYKFIANTNLKENFYYTYSISATRKTSTTDLLNCFNTDTTNPFLKDSTFMATMKEGKALKTTMILRDGVFTLPYCAAVIQEIRYNAGLSSLSTVNWKSDWTLNNGNEYTQIKTISTSNIGKTVSLTTADGKEVARVKYIASLSQTENRCPEASADQKRAVQGYGSDRWDFVSLKTHQDIYNSELSLWQVKTVTGATADSFINWYNANFAGRFLIFGFSGVLSQSEVQTKFDTLHNNIVTNLQIDNKLVGTEVCTVVDGGNGKICALPVAGKFPYLPLFTLEVQADWVGVIRPTPLPSISLIDKSISFLANERKAVRVEVGNVGNNAGTFAVGLDGDCSPNTVYVDRTSTTRINPGDKQTVTLYASSTSNKIITATCSICVTGDDPTKKVCAPLTVNVKPTTDCGGEGAQQCFGQAIYQCSEVSNTFDMTRPVLTCAPTDTCLDYKRDSTINKFAAKCKGSIIDECQTNADCEIKLEPKEKQDRVCNVPLIGIKTCKYVDSKLLQCNDGIDNDEDNKIDMQDPGCTEPTDNNETDVPNFMPWIALLGLIGFIVFGALYIKADNDDETSLKFMFAIFAIIFAGALIYSIFIWLGLITMILIAIGIALMMIGRFIVKLLPQAGLIVMAVGIVFLLIAGIIIIIKLFLATTAIGLALKLI
jgi:hypothetical protein